MNTELPQLVTTADGSHSLYFPHLDEYFHSQHGAIQESMHVFIQAGLLPIVVTRDRVRILEVGFGTGLNALLTGIHTDRTVEYTGIEKYPLPMNVALDLNYCNQLSQHDCGALFRNMHEARWSEMVQIAPHFALQKIETDIHNVDLPANHFHLCYFDAFGFRAQPEMWSVGVFARCFRSLAPGGVLVTYAAKGDVRRSMLEIGFNVEKLPGPPGKREMMRATKPFGL